MGKLRIFFRTFWKSISSFSYYCDVVRTPFAFSLKYFLVFSLLLGVTLTTGVSLLILPPVSSFLTRLKTQIPNFYPADLVITLRNGELSTNQVEPLRFPIPFELFTQTPPAISDQNQIYLLTIDTQARIGDYKTSQSLIFVTRDSVIVSDESKGTRIYDLSEFDDFTLNQEMVEGVTKQILPLFDYVPSLLVSILALTFILLLNLLRLISLLFLTLLLLAVARFLRLDLTYKKILQIGLHAHTLPTLIQILLLTFGLFVPIPFFGSLLFLLYSLVILAELKKSPTKNT